MPNVTGTYTNNYRDYSNNNQQKSLNNNLDKDAFLKLLVTQMKNQDPLSPMEDREFIAQMAQFSSLEQMQNVNETIKTGQATILEHITQMNNNMVKSNTNIVDQLIELNEKLSKLTGEEVTPPEEDNVAEYAVATNKKSTENGDVSV